MLYIVSNKNKQTYMTVPLNAQFITAFYYIFVYRLTARMTTRKSWMDGDRSWYGVMQATRPGACFWPLGRSASGLGDDGPLTAAFLGTPLFYSSLFHHPLQIIFSWISILTIVSNTAIGCRNLCIQIFNVCSWCWK